MRIFARFYEWSQSSLCAFSMCLIYIQKMNTSLLKHYIDTILITKPVLSFEEQSKLMCKDFLLKKTTFYFKSLC